MPRLMDKTECIVGRIGKSEAEDASMSLQPAIGIGHFEFRFGGAASRSIDIQCTSGVMFAVSRRSTEGQNLSHRHVAIQFCLDDGNLTLNRAEGRYYFEHNTIIPRSFFHALP